MNSPDFGIVRRVLFSKYKTNHRKKLMLTMSQRPESRCLCYLFIYLFIYLKIHLACINFYNQYLFQRFTRYIVSRKRLKELTLVLAGS